MNFGLSRRESEVHHQGAHASGGQPSADCSILNSVFGLYVCVFLVRGRVRCPGGPPSVGSGRRVAERGALDVVLGESGHIKGLEFCCNRWINTQMFNA